MPTQAKVLSVALLALGLQVGCAQAQAPQVAPQSAQKAGAPVAHVIHISVDALGSKYLSKFLQESPQDFSSFGRLISEGASTLNARTDFTHTVTLPNHTCMVTGRPVKTPADWQECAGHFWEWNSDFPSPDAAASLHATNPAGRYTYSTFDVAHDNRLSTALYSGKSKFKLYTVSYGPELGSDSASGRNKIDFSIIDNGIHEKALPSLKANHPAYRLGSAFS